MVDLAGGLGVADPVRGCGFGRSCHGATVVAQSSHPSPGIHRARCWCGTLIKRWALDDQRPPCFASHGGSTT